MIELIAFASLWVDALNAAGQFKEKCYAAPPGIIRVTAEEDGWSLATYSTGASRPLECRDGTVFVEKTRRLQAKESEAKELSDRFRRLVDQ